MPKAVRLLYRGDVCKKSFDLRLKEEGRWKDFVVDRDKFQKTLGQSTEQLDKLLLSKYGKGTFKGPEAEIELEVADEIKDGDTVVNIATASRPDGAYADKLPNGCPLWDPKIFSKADTKFYADVMWTESNLARADLHEDNIHEHCPSLSCARYFWTARYTKPGYDKHAETVALFTSRDKNALSDESRRRDSGKPLEALGDFLTGLGELYGFDKSGDDDKDL